MLRMPRATQCSANLADDWFVACGTLSFLCRANSLSGHVWLKWTKHGVQLTDFTNSSWGIQERPVVTTKFSCVFSCIFFDVFFQKISISPMEGFLVLNNPHPSRNSSSASKFPLNHLCFETSHSLQFWMTFFGMVWIFFGTRKIPFVRIW